MKNVKSAGLAMILTLLLLPGGCYVPPDDNSSPVPAATATPLPQVSYDRAMTMLGQGNYAEAAAAFDELTGPL